VLKATARSVLSKPYRVAVGVFDPGDQLPSSDADPDRQREVVEAFLAASREGDFEALLTILDERVVLRADDAAVRAGASREVRRRAGSRRHVLGTCPGGRPRVAFAFKVAAGRIVEIDILAEPEYLGRIRNSGLRTWSCRLRDLP